MNNQVLEYANWFREYDFESMITVRVSPALDMHSVHKILCKEVIEPMQRFLKTSLTALYVLSYCHISYDRGHRLYEPPHIHMLVATSRRNLNANIEPVISFLLSKPRAKLLTHPNSINIKPFIQTVHPGYVADHAVARSDIRTINDKLLSKLRSNTP